MVVKHVRNIAFVCLVVTQLVSMLTLRHRACLGGLILLLDNLHCIK